MEPVLPAICCAGRAACGCAGAQSVPAATLTEVARYWARTTPERIAYTFLLDGETDEAHLTCAALDEQARALAAKLQTIANPGDRALLLFLPGLEYVSAFFG